MAEDSLLTAADAMLALHKPAKGKALVVGSHVYGTCRDRRELYLDAVGLDMQAGLGVDLVHDLEEPLPVRLRKFAHVDCCSVLEHVRRPWLLAANAVDALRLGGTILIAAPFVWRQHAYPDDYWRFTPAALDVLFQGIDWIDRRLFAHGDFVTKAPAFNDDTDRRWFGRTEVVAFGVKCASRS
jgi:SAM-dependent methyltransferase